MAKITSGTVHIFTFKDGLLARLAHDLRLAADKWEVEVEGSQITARFWPRDFRPEGAMKKDRLEAGSISAADLDKIRDNLRQEILHVDRWPEIVFEGKGEVAEGRFVVSGELTMAGRKRAVSVPVTKRGERLAGEVTLKPSDWGIAPFKALAGAIKLKDEVRLAFDLTAP